MFVSMTMSSNAASLSQAPNSQMRITTCQMRILKTPRPFPDIFWQAIRACQMGTEVMMAAVRQVAHIEALEAIMAMQEGIVAIEMD